MITAYPISHDDALKMVRVEFESASRKWPKFNGPHEGYAVILEELDELWSEVKNDKRSLPTQVERMRAEAVQIAAMALRFIVDIRVEEV